MKSKKNVIVWIMVLVIAVIIVLTVSLTRIGKGSSKDIYKKTSENISKNSSATKLSDRSDNTMPDMEKLIHDIKIKERPSHISTYSVARKYMESKEAESEETADTNDDGAETAHADSVAGAKSEESKVKEAKVKEATGGSTQNTQSQEVANAQDEQWYDDDTELCPTEYIEPGWQYYESRIRKQITEEQKVIIDAQVKEWLAGKMTDFEFHELLFQYTQDWNIDTPCIGVTGKERGLYRSIKKIPDKDELLNDNELAYHFVGLYTEGEHDEYGYLICYSYTVFIY